MGRCIILLLFLVACLFISVLSQCRKPPIIFNFGDSNSDTGGLAAGLGFLVNAPNGRLFFNRSTGRLCDGRLIIDFLCESVKANLLSPYLDSLDSKFTNGVSFAVVGSSTLPKYVPFALNIQIMQFLHFKSRSLELIAAGSKDLINEEGFRNALYMIDIGQNDLADSFSKNMTYAEVTNTVIPLVVSEIKNAVMTIYNEGGRKFWIHNTGPLGCLPQKLSLAARKGPTDIDSHGCLSRYNNAARLFNEVLQHSCQHMRSELTDATVVYVDIFSAKYDVIVSSTQYGFSNPLMACCGYGGAPYNYNINITCGQPGCQVCNKGSGSLSWDGIHYTEAANLVIAAKILSMAYSTPPTPFSFFCQ